MTEAERAEQQTLLDHNALCRKFAEFQRDQEAVRQTLTGRIVELEQQVRTDKETYLFMLGSLALRVSEQADALEKQGFVVAALQQQVRDLTAQLAQHEAAPYPHVRYTIRDLGVIVADGLDAALADYDIDAQTDGPDAFERLSAADSAPANELPVRVYGADPTKELPTFRQYAPDSAAGGA